MFSPRHSSIACAASFRQIVNMQSLRTNLIGVDRGQVLMFSDFAEGGPMWTEEGARMVRQ